MMIDLVNKLYPINRSITGKGINESYQIIRNIHSEFKTINFKTGDKVFDWEIPLEWNVETAYLEHIETKRKFCDLDNCNLHLVGYSEPIDMVLTKSQLLNNLHYRKDLPEAIPYVTSYYKRNWGFCISYNEFLKMPEGEYRCFIKSNLKKGNLNIIDAVFPGELSNEIFFSSYLCHPSMANNELSGPVLITELIKYIKSISPTKNSYRFVLLPETIGSIAYLSKKLDELKKNVIAGFNLSCVGDERRYTHLKSRMGNTLADKALESALKDKENVFTKSFLERGSDERQYNSPGINLPLCGFSRSKFGDFKEYHTSLDNLNLVTEKGLKDSFYVMKNIIDAFEIGLYPVATNFCEPQLGKRGLYPNLSKIDPKKSQDISDDTLSVRMNILAYADGQNDVFTLSKIVGCSLEKILIELEILKNNGLIVLKNN